MSEDQQIEWKESWRDEYLKWICAFANSQGGTLVIGKRDDGSVKGIDNAKKLLESLPNKISNALGLVCDVDLKTEDVLEYIEITVHPFSSAVAYDGRYFKRTGSTTKLLTGQALSDFLREKSNLDWDEVIVSSATMNDIKEDTINSFKERAIAEGRIPSLTKNTPTETILRNLNLMNSEGKLTRAALILFGKDPKRVEFSAYLKIGKFRSSPTDLIAQDMLEMNAFELALQTIEILNIKYITRDISYKEGRRVETPEYPYDALREVIYNAIIHREYISSPITVRVNIESIEVWNMGTLPNEISIDELSEPHRSIPRNRLMANVFYMAGFIESWGRGTIKIIEECKKFGLPEPVIKEFQGGIAVTLYKSKNTNKFKQKEVDKTSNVSKNHQRVIDYILKNGEITSKDYATLFGVTDRTALRHLEELIQLEIIEKIGKSRSTRYILK